MLFNIKTLALAISSTIFITGCVSSMTTKSDKPIAEYIQNSDVSYLVFSRPEFLGAALTNTIAEFTPGTEETKLVGVLGPGNKLIHEVPPGEHYFYMSGGENDDMIKINTLTDKVYYVHTEVNMGIVAGRFYFKPYRHSSIALKDSLIGAECNQELLSKYKFDKLEDEYDFSADNMYVSDAYDISIECGHNGVKIAKYTGPALASLKSSQLIRANEKADKYFIDLLPGFQSEINEDYPGWSNDSYGSNMMRATDGIPREEI